LAAAKARGVKLGNQTQADAVAAETARRDAELRPVLVELADKPLRAIAAELTARSIPSPRGSPWNPMAVMRAMRRLGLTRSA
jgi:hypothetical protein